MKKYIFSLLLLFSSDYTYACEAHAKVWSPENYSDMYVINGPYSIKEVEIKNTYTPAGHNERVPFGVSNKKWEMFKKLIAPGDQFFNIYSEFGNDSIEKYIVVRGKCVVGEYHLSTKVIISN